MPKTGKPKIGDPRRVSLSRNCMICRRYTACRDPSKTVSYACSRFRESELTDETVHFLLDKSSDARRRETEQIIVSAKDEESISDMIDSVLSSGVPVPPDLKINDRHIPRPKNIYEWMRLPKFVGSAQPPFARQVQIGLTYLAEYCPRCSDMDFFECIEVDTPLEDIEENVVMLEYGVCPKCRVQKSDLIEEQEINDYLTLAGVAGQRSTKSATVNLIESYNTARWLLTPNLPETYRVLPSAVLTATYTAVTFNQAKNNFWAPLATIFATSEWYKEYHRFLQEQGRRYGEELVTLTETILRYRHKNILVSPVAPSKRSMRGATRISAVIDEWDWFPVGKTKGGNDFERLDAKEVYTALNNSLKTIRGSYRLRMKQGYSNLPKPLFSNISSPSSKNGALMTLYRQTQGSREVYSFKYCLSGDTYLQTRDGVLPISSLIEHGKTPRTIRSNIEVFAQNEWSRVKEVHYTGRKEVRVLHFRGGMIKATDNHQFMVLERNRLVWKRLKSLKVGDYLVSPISDTSLDVSTEVRGLFEARFEYREVMSIADTTTIEDTYDLTMEDEPCFVANGVLVHNSTWEYNPLLPRESFAEDFRLHPVETARDYGCEPPLGMNSFISSIDALDNSFSVKRVNGVKTLSQRSKTKNGKMIMSSSIRQVRRPKSNFQGVLTLDAGYSNNSFAWAILYPKDIPDRLDDEESDGDFSVKVEVFACGEVIPKTDTPISFTKMYLNVLLPLCQEYNVHYVVSDRWQNIKMLQDLEDASGVEYIEHRLSYEDMKTFREAAYDDQISFPRLEMEPAAIVETLLDDYPHVFYLKPVSHLYYQLATVQDTGSTVIKGAESTDDIFRCIVLGYTVLQMQGVLENLADVEETYSSMSMGSIPSKKAVTEVKDFGVAATARGSKPSSAGSIGTVGRNTK